MQEQPTGGVSEKPGLSELMTLYVILSRVTSAEGLLLLRAFAPDLFQLLASARTHAFTEILEKEIRRRIKYDQREIHKHRRQD